MVLAAAALALSAACTADEPDIQVPPQLAGLPMSEVSIETESGTHRFRVWVAADPASRERGLMFVRELPADHGMLFLLDRVQYTTFWMKDTYLALDLIFIGADGRVVNVAHDAQPFSEDSIPSAAPVAAVLELVAGTARRMRLASGDRVHWTAPSMDHQR
ncbi:MAG TPA: DUF192 domain-containing protein [Steroidobacteraceae bacterium]|nr:DUF192 domain-containing protein [Steroidobacteraceae bacterium]